MDIQLRQLYNDIVLALQLLSTSDDDQAKSVERQSVEMSSCCVLVRCCYWLVEIDRLFSSESHSTSGDTLPFTAIQTATGNIDVYYNLER